ncbi:MAG: peptidase S8 [Brevibacillus sp.]|nr:peptidase S8 [Brevibacillus sp.]
MREPHPSVTSLDSDIPRINYIEQTRDVRRKMERQPRVMTIHHNSRDRSHFIEHEIVVRFSPPVDEQELQQILTKLDGKVKRRNGDSMIISSRKLTTRQMMKILAEHPDSIYAEPNYILLPNRIPNDILYKRYQWNLPIIGMEEGWEISQGSKRIVVAVVDTGVDLGHPEFQGKLTNGYNVIARNQKPQDDNGHGTHVAGIIAARTNNRDGIAGMSWNSMIMPIKAIGADGSGTAFDIAEGIRWATDHGAHVINLSVGNYTSSAALQEACRYAYERNVVLVAATGNDATNQPGYPAAYPEVLGVSAVDHRTRLASFSNYGQYVDVVAPGVDIASTYIYNDYAALSGTSMACPHVAALAGLIRSVKPEMKNTEVMKLIRDSSVDLGEPGRDNWYGYGMIDSGEALRRIGEPQNVRQQTGTIVGNLIEKLFSRIGFSTNQR